MKLAFDLDAKTLRSVELGVVVKNKRGAASDREDVLAVR